MKKILLSLVFSLSVIMLWAQLQNPSFEDQNSGSLEHWTTACPGAETFPEGAPGSGSWSLQLPAGETQGCFPGIAYQPLTGLEADVPVEVSGWAKSPTGSLIAICVGTVDNENTFNTLSCDTTSSMAWEALSLTYIFEAGMLEDAVIFCNAGIVGGPVSGDTNAGLFDGLTISGVNSTTEWSEQALQIFPNPLRADEALQIRGLSPEVIQQMRVFNPQGQLVWIKKEDFQSITLSTLPPGIYFLQFLLENGQQWGRKLVKY